jgi:hypothetical protein
LGDSSDEQTIGGHSHEYLTDGRNPEVKVAEPKILAGLQSELLKPSVAA